MDIFDWEPFIRLISPKDWEDYALNNMEDAFSGNNVSLTLFNPNNAGQYLAMILPCFIFKAIYQEKTSKRIFYGILSAILLILVWFTYSRGALLAVIFEFVIGFIIVLSKNSQKSNEIFKKSGLFVLCCVIIFLIVDGTQNFKFLNRLHDEKAIHN